MFEPHGEKHAIIEVVFGLRFSRHFTGAEIESLIATHATFKERLPRINRTQSIQFQFGEMPMGNMPIAMPAAGVTFDAMKRDGTLDWRLRADENMLYVNCLAYTRWAEIWDKSSSLVTLALQSLGREDNSVTGVILQYIDAFRWTGAPDDYSLRGMLKPGSHHIPASIFDCGRYWHLHQGWFRPDGVAPGRTLERLHMDAVDDENAVPLLKIDTYIMQELQTPLPSLPGNKIVGEAIFVALHDRSKELVRSILADEVAARISLNE